MASAPSAKVKWNKLSSILLQIEATWKEIPANAKAKDSDNIEALNVGTTKLLDVLCTRDKSCKDFLSKHSNMIGQLFDMLQFGVKFDPQITINVIESFSHIISHGKGLNILLGAGIVRVVTECIVASASNLTTTHSLMSEDLFVSLYSLLLKLASKDKRFSTISRISGGVEISVSVLKNHSSHGKISSMAIQVMKMYTSSDFLKKEIQTVVNCGIMVKAGVVSLTLKMIHSCGQKKVQLLKNLLELLASICKTKAGAKKCVAQNVIPLMLSMYQESHRFDHRNRNMAVRRALLSVIKSCVNFGFGCKAFTAANGYRTLYFLGLEAMDSYEMEGCLRIIILILRKATRNNTLPLENLNSTYSFPLPEPCNKIILNDEGDEDDDEEEGAKKIGKREDGSDGESAEEDFTEARKVTEKDVPTSSTECDHENHEDNVLDVSTDSNIDIRDLDAYKVFLEELYCSQVSDDSANEGADYFIRIPTAPSEEFNLTGDSRDEMESGGSNQISFEDNLSDVSTTGGGCGELKRRTLSESNIFYKKLQSLSLQEEYLYESTDIQDLHDIIPNKNKLFSLDHSNNNLIPDNPDSEKLLINRDTLKKRLTDLTYPISEASFHNKSIYSLSNYFSRSQSADGRSSTPVANLDCPDVKSVSPFVQSALPEIFGHLHRTNKKLLNKKSNLPRLMFFQDLSRNIFSDQLISRVVFDLDKLLMNSDESNIDNLTSNSKLIKKRQTLKKSQSVPRFMPAKRRQCSSVMNGSLNADNLHSDHLVFESRFESGNLRRAIHVRQYEYDLILNADVNTDHHHQWFYFQVEKMEAGVQYRFNIINCEKLNSQFNFGMQPVCYSAKRAMEGHPHWERTGSDVCYYKNYYVRGLKANNKYYHTATFTIRFPYSNDTCYLSYHYPFTLSKLNVELQKLEASLAPRIYYRNQVLCQSLGGNNINLLTITNENSSRFGDITQRPYIVLTCRVHPGESNSSWIMKGVLDFLVSCDENARELRSMFIFKIVPMLNPDGVVNGCHRCSLSGQDLNRQWKCPDKNLHPSIYHSKAIIELMISLKKRPLVFVDFHGHSRKKNVFLYGCGGRPSKTTVDDDSQTPINSNDSDSPNPVEMDLYSGNDAVKMLPKIMSTIAPSFSLQTCNFTMEKSKEATARIVGFKELGITHCYTMESTYSGMDQGIYKGTQIGTRELEEMGWHFCYSLLKFGQTPHVRKIDEAEIS